MVLIGFLFHIAPHLEVMDTLLKNFNINAVDVPRSGDGIEIGFFSQLYHANIERLALEDFKINLNNNAECTLYVCWWISR